MKSKRPIIALILIVVSIFSLTGCYYDQDDLDAAEDQGRSDGYDDGYDDGYKDALVEYGIMDPPENETAPFPAKPQPEKKTTAGDVLSCILIGGCVVLLLITIYPISKGIVSSISKKSRKDNWWL